MPRIIDTASAILEATHQMMKQDPSVYVIGEGVPDPKACFNTTKGLEETFPGRVFDMPVSENGMTGIAIGSAINGLKPIMVHMRIDFLMYAMDQIVNNAAKWYSMFGGQKSVPIVIRAILGRGWGQGQQHAQNLEAMFAHVPGLKVVVPSNAHDAKGLLIAAIRDPNPVLFLEHRWVHYITSDVPEAIYEIKIGQAKVVKEGSDVTIVSWGYMMSECLKASEFLLEQGVVCEVIDMRTLRPLDINTIKRSLKKTRRLLVVNDAWKFCGVPGEIIAQIAEDIEIELLYPPQRLTNPDYCSPSTYGLTKHYYQNVGSIYAKVAQIVQQNLNAERVTAYIESKVHDVPNADFKGPF